MKRLWCRLFGHKWNRWGSPIEPGMIKWGSGPRVRTGMYHRTLSARCGHCDRLVIECRWAFTPEASALHYIEEGEVA